MNGLRISDRPLASGQVAKVVRIDVARFEVLPLFLAEATPAETRIAQALGAARLKLPLMPVPPMSKRIAPEIRTLPDVGTVTCVSARAMAAGGEAKAEAPLHLLRLAASELAPDQVLVNANHFLFLPPELEGAWNAYGDPIGLTLANGQVETPAQIRRACLLAGPTGAQIRRIGFADHRIVAQGQSFTPHPYGPPQRLEPGTAYTLFHGSVGGQTPPSDGTYWDVAVVGRHPIAMKSGGTMPIPRAGCVLRCPSQDVAARIARSSVTYGLPDHLDGVQAGPIIVDDGQVTEDARDVFAEEGLRADPDRPDAIPISPHAWAADWRETRAARLSAGITETGRLFFYAVEGTSSFFKDKGGAQGATLHDLAHLMVAEGARTAMHLDGGGSAQVFGTAGGAILQPRDVHHGELQLPSQWDRPLPLALRLTLAE